MSEKQPWHLKTAYSVTYTAQNTANNTEWYVANTHRGYSNSDTCIAMKGVQSLSIILTFIGLWTAVVAQSA
jgi:hypothetical protein